VWPCQLPPLVVALGTKVCTPPLRIDGSIKCIQGGNTQPLCSDAVPVYQKLAGHPKAVPANWKDGPSRGGPLWLHWRVKTWSLWSLSLMFWPHKQLPSHGVDIRIISDVVMITKEHDCFRVRMFAVGMR
jgi:hypothetical protein